MGKDKTVKLLLYCTVAKPYLYGCYSESDGDVGTIGGFGYDTSYCPKEDEDCKDRTINLNGKIVAEAECDLVEIIDWWGITEFCTSSLCYDELQKKACISDKQFYDYLFPKQKTGYAIYLKNVKPFEEPKKLSEYFKIDRYEKGRIPLITGNLEKSSQNMCYAMDEDQQLYVVIFIRAEWLSKILNREKTIEVRTSILNLLKELMNNGK